MINILQFCNILPHVTAFLWAQNNKGADIIHEADFLVA